MTWDKKPEASVYLGDLPPNKGYPAVRWLSDTIGPAGDRWKLRDLAYVDFAKARDATLFLTAWSS